MCGGCPSRGKEHTTIELTLFTRDSIYAIARICYRRSVRSSVRLSVRQSHGWIIEKRLKLGNL